MQNHSSKKRYLLALTCLQLMLPGCSSSGADSNPVQNLTAANPPAANQPPSISGAPGALTTIGDMYSFQPAANDPDGDALTFSIQNKPVWASFDAENGELAGAAQAGDVGLYTGIVVSVSDGSQSSGLPTFSVEVVQDASGSVTLSWTPPTANTDGSPLTNLAAYKFYYGLAEGDYPNEIFIDNPGIAMYVVEGLVPDTYFFVATAVNSLGVESDFSNVARKVVL